jgi:sporulation protein YlmC with PRC-barrel domain
MRMSDLLDRHVVDAEGRRIGRVRDVRLVRTAADDRQPGEAAYRIDGLVVGEPFTGDRLGYGHTVHSPRLIAALFAALRRQQYFVPWGAVAETGATIVLNTPADRLPPNDTST